MAFNVRYVINIAYEYLSLTYQRMVVLDLVVKMNAIPLGLFHSGKCFARDRMPSFSLPTVSIIKNAAGRSAKFGKYSMPMARACDSCWCALVLALELMAVCTFAFRT